MKVQCASCSTNLVLRQVPASGKIKCPKCASMVTVGSVGAPAAPKTTAAAPGELDFGSLSLPPANEPTVRPFQSTIPVVARSVTKSSTAQVPAKETPSKPSDKKMVVVSVSILAAIVSGIVAFYVVRGLVGGGVDASDSAVASADVDKGDAPDGFKRVNVEGVSALMPDGEKYEELPQALTCEAVLTPAGTTFFLASTGGNNTVVEGEKLQQKATRLLGGGIIGGSPCERNGYKGNKFVLDQCLRLPDMNIEVYQIEGRFIVVGVSKESLGDGDSFVVGQSAEPDKQTVFFDSFKIGPKPSGGFW